MRLERAFQKVHFPFCGLTLLRSLGFSPCSQRFAQPNFNPFQDISVVHIWIVTSRWRHLQTYRPSFVANYHIARCGITPQEVAATYSWTKYCNHMWRISVLKTCVSFSHHFPISVFSGSPWCQEHLPETWSGPSGVTGSIATSNGLRDYLEGLPHTAEKSSWWSLKSAK